MQRARAVRCAELGCSRGAVAPGFAPPGGFFDMLDCADPSAAANSAMAQTVAKRRVLDILIPSNERSLTDQTPWRRNMSS
jgi:hypothetical protein